jgi:predicted acyltransferase (DUF342 family)
MYKRKNNKGVIGILIILQVGMLAFIIALTASAGALIGLVSGKNILSGNRTFYSTESIASEGSYQHWKYAPYMSGTGPLLNGVTSNGVVIVDLPSYRFKVTAQSANSRTERKIVKMMTSCPGCESLSYATYAASDLDMNGNSTINGNIFSNGNLKIGGSSSVNGDAFAQGNLTGASNATGDTLSGADQVPVPSLDFVSYKAKALSSGTLFSTEAAAQTYINANPNSGKVVYIDTTSEVNLTVSSVILAIITPADLRIRGRFTAPASYPAIATKGTLKMRGNTEVNGIVYVGGEVNNTGSNNVINGSIIFTNEKASPKLTGNLTINYNASYFVNIENFVGFDTSVFSNGVKQISWSEE